MKRIQNVNIAGITPLVPPAQLKKRLPIPEAVHDAVYMGRETIKRILTGKDPRLLAVVGPCSIHDEAAAFDYAAKLDGLRHTVARSMYVVMRVYFEKPRTTVGWKGLISDPYLDGSENMAHGLALARRILITIASRGLPVATEMLDPIVPQYTSDLVSWAAIGARTTESQTHREMASGLSMPVGFKNSTDGNLQVALDAMESSRHAHSFLGIDQNGRTAVVKTRGNPFCHLILRGGRTRPNYDSLSIGDAEERLRAANLNPVIMLDCSHANSRKKHQEQAVVLEEILKQRIAGRKSIIGFMLESNLFSGSQNLASGPAKLQYGVSITDACMGWQETEDVLLRAHNSLVP